MSLGPRDRRHAADEGARAAPDEGARAGASQDPTARGETAIWRAGWGTRAGLALRRRLVQVAPVLALVAVAIVFEVAYGQLPLYSGDQHASLLHGLARAGVGLLELDWQASTVDPAPVSSLLVGVVASLDGQWLLLVFHAVLIGAYGLALLALASTVLGIERPAERLVLLAALLFVHSWLAGELAVGGSVSLRSLFTEGLGGLSAPGLTFGPALFGVLLVVSLLAYARGRPLAAVALAGAAAIFDPAHLLVALILSGAYLADSYFTIGARAAVAGAALGAAMLLPVLIFELVAFAPAPPALHDAAQDVLVDFRLAELVRPELWFGPDDVLRLAIVAAGLALAWRSALFPVLALALAVSALLTALALVTGSEALLLMLPWRLSAVLVPLGTALLLGAATLSLFGLGRVGERIAARFTDEPPERLVTGARTAVGVLAGLVIAVTLVVGGDRVGRLEAEPDPGALGRLVAADRRPGDLYLVPPRAGELRIDGGVPIYVDYRAHPYEDLEVLEWRRRLREAARVYAGEALRCRRLAALARRERITHVVVGAPRRARCAYLDRRYSAGAWTVLAVEGERGREPRD